MRLRRAVAVGLAVMGVLHLADGIFALGLALLVLAPFVWID